jgi:hypothetical protein
MTLRSSTAAIVILLVVLGAVFVLVGHAGVATSVYLAQSTPTPLPLPSADHWTENAPGQLTYNDPILPAQLTYRVVTLTEFVQGNGLQPPAADSQTPLTDALTQLRAVLEDLLVEQQFTTAPDSIDGPTTLTIQGVPVEMLRLKLQPQTRSTGEPFPGTDIALALIDLGGGQIDLIQYSLNAEPSLVAYQDFMAWLDANAQRLSSLEALTTPTPTPAAEATEAVEPTAEATEALAPAAEATEAAPAAETTEAVTPAAEATEEAVSAASTEEATPAPEATEAATPAAESTEPSASSALSASNWVEVNPGVLAYAGDPNVQAQLGYQTVPLEQFILMAGLQTPAEGVEVPTLDLLQQMRATIEVQLGTFALASGPDAFEGPLTETVGGVQMETLHIQIAPQAASQEGSPDFPGLDLAFALIDLGDGNLSTVQYFLQAEPSPAAYADYRVWLEANAATLAVPPPEATAPATEAAE